LGEDGATAVGDGADPDLGVGSVAGEHDGQRAGGRR
jgi:hypothetical protein